MGISGRGSISRKAPGRVTAIPAGLCRIGVRPLGQLDYGRNYGLLYDVAGWTDVLPEFGNDSYEAADNFMTGRANAC